MESPLVSVIIPCYNQAHFLSDCLHSLIRQTFPNWEAIIVNDGSNDHTEELAREFTRIDSRIQLISQGNQGLSGARNSGLKLAKGEFLLFLDADDWLESNCLQTFFETMEANPNCSLIRAGYAYWDRLGGNKSHEHLPFANGLIYPQVLISNIGPCHSILIRKNLALEIGEFDAKLKSCEDWDFWMRAGRLGAKIFSIPKVLVAYRYVLDSMSRNPQVMYAALSEVSKRATLPDPRISNEEFKELPVKIDLAEIQKKHLITMVGVLLHQGKAKEAIVWYQLESEKWNWKIQSKDWSYLSSYLSWAYFSSQQEIGDLLKETKPVVLNFFKGLGYLDREIEKLVRLVFGMQFKKLNHLKYGKYLGGLRNKLDWY
ncbi:MAG: glycosyltransferase [Algoriphagus sp.]|uniref:glycosyltransferase family 2 protein n=1 Tax=Algoriphagus sp. TaxID=1872435 RepID=UPI002626C067|nr:glycosyltransferase [Algoriphagus sp.]MDG1277526.1 glycosyltransferase [Algoriphagus sp.]